MSSIVTRFRIAARDALAWREWANDVVVYCPGTGNTHLLGPLGGAVLKLLVQTNTPMDAHQLEGALPVDWEGTDHAERIAQIEGTLAEFSRIGLTEALPC